VAASSDLERGRDAYGRRAWSDAYAFLAKADASLGLETGDLELLATSAYMLGRDHEFVQVLERAHNAYLEARLPLRAVRCAFWCGMTLLARGEIGPGSGWIGRAQRILEQVEEDCVEHAYLLMPAIFQREAGGDFNGAAEIAAQAAAIAARFGDADGFALATHGQGSMLIKAGRVADGLALLDESMLGVTAGELSPIPTGLVYCGVILACQEVYDVVRARDWTEALARWCDGQPDVVAFTGRCRVHRSEILQLSGAWPDALAEAERARTRFIESENMGSVGLAYYREAELRRLLGQFEAAERSYTQGSRHGWDAQPGLAQLRLAQGRIDAARASIERALDEPAAPLRRVALLPAQVEIALAAGDVIAADRACSELEGIVERYESAMIAAMAAYARGAVALAQDDPTAALASLRTAAETWRALDAPYEIARARELVGRACRSLGDDDTATLELEAALEAYLDLGATPDATRVRAYADPPRASTHGLTPRELDVLRLVASGMSNREVARELVISEHTVARHLQNVFARLGVASRTAAVSFAFEHDLL
jgi:DNA-binding NarL/FixJ family response regulator